MLIVKEMLRTKTKLDDLLERYKDLDLTHVKNKFEEYDDLVQYYSILRIKPQEVESSGVPQHKHEKKTTNFQKRRTKSSK